MGQQQQGCVQPAQGPIVTAETDEPARLQQTPEQKESKMLAHVGSPAPDFEATAFVDGAFKNVKVSDYKGQWVVVCFCPGDFTFV